MNDYISREEALAVFGDIHPQDHNANAYRTRIKKIPAADVRPVVHGKLIHETIDTDSSATGKFYSPTAICSICGSRVIANVNFCPFCGADVREEAEGSN